MNIQVFAMSYDTATPPSLPISTWFEFAGSIQIACTSSCVDARDVGRDRLAAVERQVQADAAEVDDLGIVRIDAHLAEVHRPRVGVVHLPPRRAAVVGAVEAGRLRR